MEQQRAHQVPRRPMRSAMSDRWEADPELRPVDRLCEQWAEQTAQPRALQANGIARAMGMPSGGFVMTEDVLLLDGIIARAPRGTKERLDVWYRSDATAAMKASRLGVSRSKLYEDIKGTLRILYGLLIGKGIDLRAYDY